MYEFITAAEAIKRLNIKTFQLFELIITGRIEAYTEYGKKVINSDVLEHRPMDTLERIFANLKAKQKAATLGISGGRGPRTDEELQGMAKRRYRQQPFVIVNQPPDTEAVSFTKLSNNMQLATETVMKFLFREIEIATFQSADGLPIPAKSESSSDHRSKEESQKTLPIKRWIYGWELLQLGDWTALELLNHIKNGLPAYDGEVGRRIIDLDTLPRQKQTHEEIAESIRCKFVNRDNNISVGDIEPGSSAALKGSDEFGEQWFSKICEDVYESQPGIPVIPPDCEAMSLTLPPDNTQAVQLLDAIKLFRFKNQDVLEYRQNYGLTVEEQLDNTSPATDKHSLLKNNPWGDNYFVLDGDYWKVCFKGDSKSVRNLKGMRYIGYLLSDPGKDIPILTLMDNIEHTKRDPDKEYDHMTPEQFADQGMHTGERLSESKSEAEQKEAKRLLKELNDARKGGIQMEIDEAQKEYDDYMKNYLNTLKQDNADPQFENERRRIQKLIKTAIDNISKCHKDLGQHLAVAIKTGISCSYIHQEESIDWYTK